MGAVGTPTSHHLREPDFPARPIRKSVRPTSTSTSLEGSRCKVVILRLILHVLGLMFLMCGDACVHQEATAWPGPRRDSV